jgi:hypothetical protein
MFPRQRIHTKEEVLFAPPSQDIAAWRNVEGGTVQSKRHPEYSPTNPNFALRRAEH